MRWKPISKTRGFYEVSDTGAVRRVSDQMPLSGYLNGGYQHVYLKGTGSKRSFPVHRLVYEAFVCHIPKGRQINHINSVRNDNRLENLEVVTPWQNVQHSCKRPYKDIPRNLNFKTRKDLENKKGIGLVSALEASKMLGMGRSAFYRWTRILKLSPVAVLPTIYAFYKPDIEKVAALVFKKKGAL